MRKRTISVLAVGLLFLGAFTIVSCEKEELNSGQNKSPTANNNNAKLENLTGEDWFKSVIYANGPVTNRIASLEIYTPNALGYTADELDALLNFQDLVLAKIREMHPDYFDSFKTAMESNDPTEVQDALLNSRAINYYATEQVLLGMGHQVPQYVEDDILGGEVAFGAPVYCVLMVYPEPLPDLVIGKVNDQQGFHDLSTLSYEILAAEIVNL